MRFQSKVCLALAAPFGAVAAYTIYRLLRNDNCEEVIAGPRIMDKVDALPAMMAKEVRHYLEHGGVLIAGASKTEPNDIFIGIMQDWMDPAWKNMLLDDCCRVEILPAILPFRLSEMAPSTPLSDLVRSMLLRESSFRSAYDGNGNIAGVLGVKTAMRHVSDGILTFLPSSVHHLISGRSTQDYTVSTFILSDKLRLT